MWRNAVLCLLAVAGTMHMQASFLVGLTYEYIGSVDSLHTYRIYAEFNNPGDELVALYGEAGAPWSLELDGQLFQAANGGPLAEPGADAQDSWFTIGEDGTTGVPALYQVGMGEAWEAFESGTGFVLESLAGESVFALPGTVPSALAGSDGRVLIAQLTMTGTAELTLNLQWRTPGGINVPQPGVYLAFPEEIGCTDEEACNYDSTALVDNGSCSYNSSSIFDCEGDCNSDIDGDGICDELEIWGCTLPQADNFNVLATEEDGSCLAPGCTDETASNFVPWAIQEDGSCFWLGCTDMVALNFDPEATQDDGSCTYPAPSYAGLVAEAVPDADEGWFIYRVYATFTNPEDELIAVFGDAVTPLYALAATGFGQDADGVVGFNEMPDSGGGTVPDSWLALGDNSDIQSIGMAAGLAAFETGDDLILDSQGGAIWYVWPGEGAGEPDLDGRVLLGQFASTGLVQIKLNLQYIAQSGEVVQAIGQLINFPDLPAGCQNAAACNYDATAQVENGTCEFVSCLGCTDNAACNFDATATTNDASCTYPEIGFDCSGNCLADEDGDGICDANEIAGCTEVGASNYNPEATDEDGNCIYLGCTDSAAINYNSSATDDDGSCLLPGCMDPDALNFDASSNVDGDCTFAAPGYEGLEWELTGVVDGVPTYRFYAAFENFNDQLVALFGTAYLPLNVSTTSSFVQHPEGALLASGTSGAAALLDSWFTLGMFPGLASELQSVGLGEPGAAFEAGGNLQVHNPAGGMWFILPAESYDGSAGYPANGRVLLGQLITSGQVSIELNLQFEAPSGDMIVVTDSLNFPTGILGCTDPQACNYVAGATLENDNCDYSACAGCMDTMACNFDGAASLPDTSLCTYPPEFYDCLGNCLEDVDGDDICDALEIPGCTDFLASNFDSLATDDDAGCLYPGCTLPEALNFNPQANEDDGSCIVEGCSYSTATNYNPTATTDDGSCIFDGISCPEDADEDGICDFADPCIGTLDPCGICNGPGPVLACGCENIPCGACDCDGNVLDALGICGGNCDSDADGDGVCDDVDLCVGELDNCGVCNGLGNVLQCGCTNIPEGHCDCNGNVLDALGVCGGGCTSDSNSNGVCDDQEFFGCTYAGACNFEPEATNDDGTCTFPLNGLDCNGVCLMDSDGDGTCDENELLGCTAADAVNFSPLATEDDGTCQFIPSSECPVDIDNDGVVGVGDILDVLSSFGLICD